MTGGPLVPGGPEEPGGPVVPDGFRLVGNQRLQLADALFNAFPTWPDFDRLIRDGLGEDPNRVTSRAVLRNAVDELINWSDSRSVMRKLVDKARQLNPDNELLKATALLVEQGTAPGIDDFRTPVFGASKNPMIDRETLRDAVSNMAGSTGGSVLAVQGPKGSGKSYTATFISHVVQNRRIRIATIDLTDLLAETTAGELVETIAMQIGRSESISRIPPRPPHDQTARWVLQLTDWLIGEIRILLANPTLDKVWIVFDGFAAVRDKVIDPSLRDLALRLAGRSQTIPELVVVLLDYPEVLPKIESQIQRETLNLPTKEDVERFYRAVNQLSPRPVPDALLPKLVEATWQEADPYDPDDHAWLTRLSAAARKRLRGLHKDT